VNPNKPSNLPTESLKHFCGVVGLFSEKPVNVPVTLFFPLFSIQHRGQESAGIAYRKNDTTVTYKDIGMVNQVLSKYLDSEKLGTLGIGHVRYSTHGGNKIENAQPLQVSCNKGEIALAHNGNLTNTTELKEMLVKEGSIFQTTSDSEILLHLISRSRKESFESALVETLTKVKGAFSLVMLHDDTLIAVRDPWGFRPLYIGTRDGMTLVASESCALDVLQVTEYRHVEPGEIIFINKAGTRSIFIQKEQQAQCVFELIYFARPDSKVFDVSVYQQRKMFGKALAKKDVELYSGNQKGQSIVIPVPDSGNTAALGYAEESGLPFEQGLTRNHYTGRSFIMPTTAERELVVRMKLHPIREVIQDKRVFLIDDSLVRGTTAKILVKLLREYGAKEIHLRLSSPEIRWPCFFGIDIPTRQELISNTLTPEEISNFVKADSVKFLTIDDVQKTLDQPNKFCFSCFSGRYPLEVPLELSEKQLLPRDKKE
jgi:amidophosphoribosyltransferase